MFWLIQQRRWDEALEAVAPELLRQPEHSYWLLRRAQLLALRGDRTQAIELVRKLCIPQPTHLLSASTLFELQLHHDPVAARGLGERCMKEQPHNRHSARIFARGVLATQEWDVAEQVLQVGIQEFPDDQVLLALRAELTLRREETKPNKPAAQAARRDLAAAMENGLEEPLQAIVCARLQQRLGEEPSQTRHLAEQLLDIYPLTLLQEEFARG
jgi:predicted Zn-dependent protease